MEMGIETAMLPRVHRKQTVKPSYKWSGPRPDNKHRIVYGICFPLEIHVWPSDEAIQLDGKTN